MLTALDLYMSIVKSYECEVRSIAAKQVLTSSALTRFRAQTRSAVVRWCGRRLGDDPNPVLHMLRSVWGNKHSQ